MPGPGSGIPEHEFRRRQADQLAREGARVFAAIYRCIAEHTVLAQEQAEELARAVADTHTATLSKKPGGS